MVKMKKEEYMKKRHEKLKKLREQSHRYILRKNAAKDRFWEEEKKKHHTKAYYDASKAIGFWTKRIEKNYAEYRKIRSAPVPRK